MPSFQQLRRSATDRKVSGLCGGAARQWGIDPLLVRVLAVLLAVSGGLGVVLYLAGWLLIPEEGHGESLATTWVPQSKGWPREVWIVAVVVACVACAGALGSIAPVGLAPALIVVAVWYFGFRHRGPGRPDRPERHDTVPPARVHDPLAGPPTPFTQAAREWQARMAEHRSEARSRAGDGAPAAVTPPRPSVRTRPPTAPTPPAAASTPAAARSAGAPMVPFTAAAEQPVGEPRDPFFQVADPVGLYTPPATTSTAVRRRTAVATPTARRLRWGVLLVAALAMAALAVAAATGVSVPWVLYPATALLIVGIGLVVATWAGRARGLLALGIVLLIATPLTQLGAEAADRIPTQWGSETLSYSRQQDLPATASFPGGDYSVDLSGLTVTKPQTYTVHVQMGQLRIRLPQDARVDVRASASTGSVDLPDKQAGGRVGRLEGVYGPKNPDAPTLIINASVDVGSVEVVR